MIPIVAISHVDPSLPAPAAVKVTHRPRPQRTSPSAPATPAVHHGEWPRTAPLNPPAAAGRFAGGLDRFEARTAG